MTALQPSELIVDLFAGGGGASQGVFQALGRHPDEAINHDEIAVAVHAANHPETRHHCASVWKVEPRETVAGRPVGLLWASPDCRHFSRAAGGRPVTKTHQVRLIGNSVWPGLAEAVVRANLGGSGAARMAA